jgi:hypothetical protein
VGSPCQRPRGRERGGKGRAVGWAERAAVSGPGETGAHASWAEGVAEAHAGEGKRDRRSWASGGFGPWEEREGERARGEGEKGRDAGLGWPAAGLGYLLLFFFLFFFFF